MMNGCKKILMLLALMTISSCVSLDMTGKDDCESDADCLNGYFCNPDGKCEEEESGCTSDADCKTGRICEDESCVQGCQYDTDCPGSQYCLDGRCVDRRCEPSNTQSCACPEGGEGFQTCHSDGSGWSTCECEQKCPPGETRCGEVCVDLDTNDDHCSACDTPCGAYAVCIDAICRCLSGYTFCPDGCVNTDWDSSNCGECGNDCGSDICVLGECRSEAGCEDFGLEQCGDDCFDTQSDTDHCSTCFYECEAGELCISGECMFSDCVELGLTFCGDDCVDIDTNTAHCGGCDSPCTAGEFCIAGECLGDCCGGQPLHGYISGEVRNLLSTGPEALSLAAVSIMEALLSPDPMHLSETTSDTQGHFQTDCMDLDGVAIGVMMLADDSGFDGAQGQWYPTYSPVMEIEPVDDLTCVPEAPGAWAMPTLLVFSLDVIPGMEDIIANGFALVFILDTQGNPVAGAELKKDGNPPENLQVVYPDASWTDFYGTSTSSVGVALVPGPMTLTNILAVKSGMQWEPRPIGIVEGFCFTRTLYANY